MKIAGIAANQLRSIIERIERLEEEKSGIASDIKDIFAGAKGNGYDVKTLRKILSLRKQDANERDEAEHLLDTYKRALGMQPDLFEGDETDTTKGKSNAEVENENKHAAQSTVA